MIEIKSDNELDVMRAAGRVVGGMLEDLSNRVRVGLTTKALDDAAMEYIRGHGAKPAFLGYRGFPAAICISINEEIVHGIPGSRIIKDGDLVSLDVGAIVDDFYADAAITVIVGSVDERTVRLTEATSESLEKAIEFAKAGNRLSDISHAVQQIVESNGFGVVRDFVGHGIGRELHEDPPIPNFGDPHIGPRLQEGMVIAIEPMVTMGDYEVKVLEDGWTAITKDGSLAAHFEHTVAITANGPEILTAHKARKTAVS